MISVLLGLYVVVCLRMWGVFLKRLILWGCCFVLLWIMDGSDINWILLKFGCFDYVL